MLQLADGHIDREHRQDAIGKLPLHDLQATFAQHPFAQRDDQAGFLGQRDEAHRRHLPKLRTLPAHQCFGTDQLAIRGTHLWLQMHGQFALIQRPAQQIFYPRPLARRGGHLRRIKTGLSATGRLGTVHRRIRIAHQIDHAFAIPRIEGDAHRGAKEEFVIADLER